MNLEDYERAARELLEARMSSVRALVASRAKLDELRTQLADVEREDSRVYAAAVRDGWTADELKKLGLTAPESGHKPRRRATAKSASAASDAACATGSDEPDGGPTEDHQDV